MKSITSIFIIILILMTFNSAYGHQPKLITDEVTIIKNPEVSQAFYSELTGKPHIYLIESEISFRLYVGILVPDVPGIDKDVSVLISKNEDQNKIEGDLHEDFEILLNGTAYNWKAYHEEFAGDDYFNGPALESSDSRRGFHPKGIEVESGTYIIEVFSPDNIGKYVLVVGDKEEFPFSEIINAVITIPQLKPYFEKSSLEALASPFVLGFIIIILLISVLIISLTIFLVKRVRRIIYTKNRNWEYVIYRPVINMRIPDILL